jgi:hypothetical protein
MLGAGDDDDHGRSSPIFKQILLFWPLAIGITDRHAQQCRKPRRNLVQSKSSKLDWTRMLGFEQIADTRVADQGDAKLHAKVGQKVGQKVGSKIGTKPGMKA